jgi:hypothetical protein
VAGARGPTPPWPVELPPGAGGAPPAPSNGKGNGKAHAKPDGQVKPEEAAKQHGQGKSNK